MDSTNSLSKSGSFIGRSLSADLSQVDKINAIPNKVTDNVLMDGLCPEDQLYLDALISMDSDKLNNNDDDEYDTVSHRSSTWSPMVQSPMMDPTRVKKLRPSYAVTLSLKDISYIRPSWGISKGIKSKSRKNHKSSSISVSSETIRSNSDEHIKSKTNEPAYHYFLSILTIIVICLIVTTYIVDRRNEHDSIQVNRVKLSIGQKFLEFYRPISSDKRDERAMDGLDLERILKIQIAQNVPRDLKPDKCTCEIYSSETRRYNPNKTIEDEETCFACYDWAFRANLRVYISHNNNLFGNNIENSTYCYHIKWQSYDALQTPLVDCFLIDNEQWFGLGDIQSPLWSLNDLTFDWTPLVTNLSAEFRHTPTTKAAPNQLALGSHVNYSLFSTKGIHIGNIYTDFETSFKISNDSKTGLKRMCLSVSCTDKCTQTWARIDHLEQLRYHNNYLEYDICTSNDLGTLISSKLEEKTHIEYETIKESKQQHSATYLNNNDFVLLNNNGPQQQSSVSSSSLSGNLTRSKHEKMLEKEMTISTTNSTVATTTQQQPLKQNSTTLAISNQSINTNSTVPSTTIVTPQVQMLVNPEMSVSISSKNVSKTTTTAQQAPIEQELPEGIDLIERTVFFVSRDYMPLLDGQTLRKYIDNVTSLNLTTDPMLLIDTRWEVYIGSLKLNNAMFPKASQLFESIHQKGFKIVFTIKPYIDSGIGVSNINQLFKNGRLYTASYKKDTHMEKFGFQAKESLNIKETLTRRQSLFTFHNQPIEIGLNDTVKFPYLFKCRESQEGYCVLLDLTLTSNREWFVGNIKRSNLFTVKADGLQIGGAHPNRFYWDDNYRNGVSELARTLVFKENLYTIPQWTGDFGYIQLAPRECTWNGLKSIVNSVLNLSMMGFSLIHPGSVWGDLKKTGEVMKTPVKSTVLDSYRMMSILEDEDIDDLRPTEEDLIIRWLQVSIFLPILQFNNIQPIIQHNLQELARNLTRVRREFIVPEMERNLPYTPMMINQTKYQMNDVKLPMIRPVRLIKEDGSQTIIVPEQFSIGQDLIVAPILNEGQRQRDIYLPSGLWRDELKQIHIRGSKWLTNYTVGLKEIAWFTRAKRK